MSAEKADYPHRPMKRGRPKSSQSGGGKRKSWMSLRDDVKNGLDVSTHLNFPWFKSPMYVEARLKKWGTM